DRDPRPKRVLYVAGRPNWEFKFLHRSVEDDKQIEMVALIRIARREPKFEFIGRKGEGGNPIFRGFGKTDEEHRYDQPILVRVGMHDKNELRSGFPKTAEELFS